MKISRRALLGGATGLAAGLTPAAEALARASAGNLPKRTLGRTGVKVPVIGFGVAPLGSSKTTPAEAESIVRAAIDLGVTYLDVSPDYGDAEAKLKNALKGTRERVFLVTKVNPNAPDATGVQRQIEESLKRMGTDHVDAVHVHNLGDFDMAMVTAPNGTIAGLKEARRRGLIRFIGTSGHMRPPRFVTAIETGDIDLTMNALNFADRNNYDFEGLVLPAAKKHRTAVVAMKVLGGAKGWQYDGHTPASLADYHARAIRYSLGLPGVCTAVIGLSNVDEVKQAIAVAHAYRPLSSSERAELLKEGQRLAQARGLYYGPTTG
jgi:aryl-alcohol dehydrogenase-like predicted oxidoreductase